MVAGGAVQWFRPIPHLAPRQSVHAVALIPGTPPPLPWPGTGEAAVSVPELGRLGRSGPATALPIASVAKVMTGLVTLEAKPLKSGEDGPSIAITPADVAEFQAAAARGESVLPVAAGEQLTELQALQGLLIPSGNNVASILSRWVAGSVPAMVGRMNERAAALRMTSTHFDDASGFSPRTVSTAADLLLLGAAAIGQPALLDVVAQPEATLPVAGRVFNVNAALGRSGIAGIKTGSSPEAGACLLFLARRQVGERAVLVLGAVVGLDTLDATFRAATALADAVGGGLVEREVAAPGARVGHYRVPWGTDVDILARGRLTVIGWPGTEVRVRLAAQQVKPELAAGTAVGYLQATAGDQEHRVAVTTADPIYRPGRAWRLTRTDPLA